MLRMKHAALTVKRPIVWVDLQLDRKAPKSDQLAMFELTRRLTQWMLDTNCLPIAKGSCGPLGFEYGFYAKDAKKVLTWLKEEGVG